MIYVVEIDNAGKTRVWCAANHEQYYRIARLVLQAHGTDAAESVEAITEAARRVLAHYEVFESVWSAAESLARKEVPTAAEGLLRGLISRHQAVASRGYGVAGVQ